MGKHSLPKDFWIWMQSKAKRGLRPRCTRVHSGSNRKLQRSYAPNTEVIVKTIALPVMTQSCNVDNQYNVNSFRCQPLFHFTIWMGLRSYLFSPFEVRPLNLHELRKAHSTTGIYGYYPFVGGPCGLRFYLP